MNECQSISHNRSQSEITIKDRLTFILVELGIPDHEIWEYFAGLASTILLVPANGESVVPVYRRSPKPTKPFYLMKGFYPGTPIAYSMLVIPSGEGPSRTLYASIDLAKSSSKSTRSIASILNSAAESDLLGAEKEVTKYTKPRILTPKGVKPQPYRSRRSTPK